MLHPPVRCQSPAFHVPPSPGPPGPSHSTTSSRPACFPLPHLRQREEGGVAAVEEGAADHLQDEGSILQLDDRDGGAQDKTQAQQRRQGQRRHRGAESCSRGGGTWFRREEKVSGVEPKGEQEKPERSGLSHQNQAASQHQLLAVDDSPPICQSNGSALPSSLGLPNSLTDAVASKQRPPRIRDDEDGYYYYHCHL